MFDLLIIAGGVALILFGIRFLRKGLDRLFGSRLAIWMQQLAGNRLRTFAAGVGLGVIVPSSTTVSLLSVQTVRDKHLSARSALALMFGAEIAMTLMVILIALQLEQYAPILVLVGVVLFQFMKSNNQRGIGQLVLSLGLIFMGIAVIKQTAAGAIDPDGDVARLIAIAEKYRVGLAILAAVMAVGLQSSTATIGTFMAIAGAGAMKLDAVAAVVIGANVGIAITTLTVGWPYHEARRLGASNLLAKVILAAVALSTLPLVVRGLQAMPLGDSIEPRIAAMHTGFNIALAIFAVPSITLLLKAADAITPARPAGDAPAFGPRYINNSQLDEVSIATRQSLREILRVAEIAREMLEDLWVALRENDLQRIKTISERDDEIDLLDRDIKRYLTRLVTAESDPQIADEQMRQLNVLSEIETIGDIIDKNLCELVAKKVKMNLAFSEQGWEELNEFYQMVLENMVIAETAFQLHDPLMAQKLLRHKEHINNYERQLRERHFGRLNKGMAESHETSAIHLDLLTHLKRINSCVSHVAYSILRDQDNS